MQNAETSRGRDRTAIAISIAVHLCVLFGAALLFRDAFPAGEPDARAYLTAIVRIERRPTPMPEAPRRNVSERPVVRDTPPPVHAERAVEHAVTPLFVARENRAGVQRREHRNGKPAPPAGAVAVALAVPTEVPTPTPTPMPPAAAATPAPTPAPVATAAVTARDDAIGNFGETYPAAIDPQVRSAFFSGLAGSFDVRITVDDSGRATAVEFVRAPDDAALREQLRARLLAAHFVPAACNGLRCAGTLELRN
jgi:hypothetical protein